MELLQALDPLTASAIGGAVGSIVLMLIRQYLISSRKENQTAQELLQKSRERSDDLRQENAKKLKIIYQLRTKNFELKKENEMYRERIKELEKHQDSS